MLRGFGLGGWMNMENFITGYPATERPSGPALRAGAGAEKYGRFFDRFLTYSSPRPMPLHRVARAQLGPDPRQLPPLRGRQAPFGSRERVQAAGPGDRPVRAAGLYTIIDLHALPGYQNQHWHSDNPTHQALFWQHKHFQDRVVHCGRRSRDATGTTHGSPATTRSTSRTTRSGEVIGRSTGGWSTPSAPSTRDHVMFLEGNRYSMDFHMFGEPWPGVVYTDHDYALPGFVDGGASRASAAAATSTGKCSRRPSCGARSTCATRDADLGRRVRPVYTGDPRPTRCATSSSAISSSIYRQHGASWSMWPYKDIGLQGLVYADAGLALSPAYPGRSR